MSTHDSAGWCLNIGASPAEQQNAGVIPFSNPSVAAMQVQSKRNAKREQELAQHVQAGGKVVRLDRLIVLLFLYALLLICALAFVQAWIDQSLFAKRPSFTESVYWVIGLALFWKFLSWLRRVWR